MANSNMNSFDLADGDEATCLVIVYGGTCAAVEAAVAARRAGAEVTLVTPRMYLGEDVAGALRLAFDPADSAGETIEENPRKPIVQEVFGTGPVTPLLAKQRLLDYAASAGVKRLFGTAVRGVARGGDGRLAAVEVADRSGRRFIPCSAFIDATPRAAAAELAGARRSDFQPGPRVFSRRVIAGERPEAEGLAVAETGLAYPAAIRYMGGFWGDTFQGKQDENLVFGNFTARLYDCRAELGLDALAPSALAAAEGRMRELTWTRRQLDHADLASFDDGRRLASAGTSGAEVFRAKDAPEVFVLGAAAFDAPADRARLSLPGFGGEAGRKVGQAAAETAKGNPRPAGECATFASAALPVAAECDVLVVGGGTAGAPAAIAAARSGARTILCEAFDDLGGTMTEGRIGNYWYGNLCGFTTETDIGVRRTGSAYSEAKAEWFRREVVKAGGEVWFNSPVIGVLVEGGRVAGVEILGPDGHCAVLRCRAAVDATGNALLAAWAGAETVFLPADDLALQATGWAMHDLGMSYNNTHLALVDVTDAAEMGRMAEASLRGLGPAHWNQAQLEGSRERRRIVGEATVSPLDILCHRTWPDTVTRCYSDFDTHGQASHPIFFALGLVQNAKGEWADLPYRALLPKGVDGLLVTGLGVSAHRDAMPILRMQPDVQNHGYAAGLAAAMAVAQGVAPRAIDVRALQRKLVDTGILPETVLAETDSFPPADDALAAAVEQVASGDWRGLAPLFAATDRALPPLRAAYAQAADDGRTNLAIALGLLGDGTGEAALADALEAADFSRGWDYDGVTDKGYKGGPADRALWALGACRGERAVAALAAAAPKIAAHPFYSHFRAYAMAAESIGDKRLAAPLAALLAAPGVRGHASRELAPLPYERKGSRLANKIVGDILRELALARAILVVADGDEAAPGAAEAKQTLEEYAADARGVFAAYARKVLQGHSPVSPAASAP